MATDPATLRDALLGTWWQVPEQDTAAETVYLKDGSDLPPARGRRGFTLHANGRAELIGPGPTDRRARSDGSWTLDAQGRLQVTGSGGAQTTGAVASVDARRLALRR